MKKLILMALCLIGSFQMFAQQNYWVFFTDKNNTSFNPDEYFDLKALQRYENLGLRADDYSNYPLNTDYMTGVLTLADDYIGQSRWFNAVAVEATPEEIKIIDDLPYVKCVREIQLEAQVTEFKLAAPAPENAVYDATLHQVAMMQGSKFQEAGISGKGVRIAVFDGGFKDVEKHPAFKKMRDNKQIVGTWNFVQKKADVYNGLSHGRMVLSCIGGLMNDSTLLGLAPDAEYLLARTEIESEIKREEVWWVQALEWADKNGADIVNSSLGYGSDRYSKRDMNGERSLVARAANTAARKGILVCTAMGNEGDEAWKVLVTPADADSVLSVGAAESLEERSGYSSYGPTADGRMKPNVAACGHDMVADKNGNYCYSQGTSFATPMVAGFAACVKQMHPEWTVLQLMEEIQKSGNRYPYYDYSMGYGVPQASYFTDSDPQKPTISMQLYEDDVNIYMVPVNRKCTRTLFYNVTNGDGSIDTYNSYRLLSSSEDSSAANTLAYTIDKSTLQLGQTLKLWFDNQYAQYVVGKDSLPFPPFSQEITAESTDELYRSSKDFYTDKMRKDRHEIDISLVTGLYLPTMWSENGNINQRQRMSRSLSVVIDNRWRLGRVYRLGIRVGFGSSWYATDSLFAAKQIAGLAHETPLYNTSIKKSNIKTTQFDLEFYQRFKLSSGTNDKSWFIDTGIYGEWITGNRYKLVSKYTTVLENDNSSSIMQNNIKNVQKDFFDDINKLNYGVRVRIGYGNFALFGQYRISKIMKNGNDLPEFQVGIQLF